VRRGWHAINPSVAVLYRKIDRDAPTLLLDELDNYPLDERRDALAVLNAGYKRGARVDRCKENGELQSFSCYCPKAYAGIDSRQLVDTLLSRSITIRLERRLPTEPVEMWIGQLTEHQAVPLRERCEGRTVPRPAPRPPARTAAGSGEPGGRGLVGAARHRRRGRRGLAGQCSRVREVVVHWR
jgi:hypothetical protein